MAATDEGSSSFRQYKIPILATPTNDRQISAFPASPKKVATGDHRNSRNVGRDTPLVAYLCSRPESQRQNRVVKDVVSSFQVPLQQIASPYHEHGTRGLPFLSTTKIKSVPLPVVYVKHQHTPMNKGIRNVSLHSDRFIPLPKRTRIRSDSLLNLHQKKKKNILYEHLLAREHCLEHSRLLKLQSEIFPHRINHSYYMSGKEMTLKDRYAVPEEELLRLKKLNLSANAELYYGKGMSQKKAVKPKHREFKEDKSDGREEQEDDKSGGVVCQLDDRDNADNLSSASEAESEKSSNNDTETHAVAVPKEPTDRKITITLTTSDSPSNTFITDLKVTDPNMLDDISDEDMIEIYRKKFEELDIDGSGSITLDELRATLFGAASEGDIHFIMSLFDLDNSNSIELDEFITVASLNDKMLGKKRTADEPLQLDLTQLSQHLRQYKELFGLFDDDGNGEISIQELMILLSAAMGIDEASNPELMNGILNKIDKDESGTIDFHEFLRAIPFFLGIHDKILTEPLSIRQLHTAKVTVRQHLRK